MTTVRLKSAVPRSLIKHKIASICVHVSVFKCLFIGWSEILWHFLVINILNLSLGDTW